MFEWSGLRVRISASIGLILFALFAVVALNLAAWAQESENPNAGTIQGTVRSEDDALIESARISYSSSATDTRGITRTGKDGKYVTEQLPPGTYLVQADGRDMLLAETTVVVVGGSAATVNFKLDWINPGPARLESHYSGDTPNSTPERRQLSDCGRDFPGSADSGRSDLRSRQKRVSVALD